MNQTSGPGPDSPDKAAAPAHTPPREADALYQSGRRVARVRGTEIDDDTKEVRFDEVYESDGLMIPEECEFRDFRILIQRIAYATKIERGEEHKGRVLRGVSADLLGFREM
jgi:hypothetical protein